MENAARHSRVVLINHNIEWQATLLWSTLRSKSWAELYPLEMEVDKSARQEIFNKLD